MGLGETAGEAGGDGKVLKKKPGKQCVENREKENNGAGQGG